MAAHHRGREGCLHFHDGPATDADVGPANPAQGRNSSLLTLEEEGLHSAAPRVETCISASRQ